MWLRARVLSIGVVPRCPAAGCDGGCRTLISEDLLCWTRIKNCLPWSVELGVESSILYVGVWVLARESGTQSRNHKIDFDVVGPGWKSEAGVGVIARVVSTDPHEKFHSFVAA